MGFTLSISVDAKALSKKIGEHAVNCIRLGRCSLYMAEVAICPDVSFVLRMPGKPSCGCGCGHSDEIKLYWLDKEFNILELPMDLSGKVIGVVRIENDKSIVGVL